MKLTVYENKTKDLISVNQIDENYSVPDFTKSVNINDFLYSCKEWVRGGGTIYGNNLAHPFVILKRFIFFEKRILKFLAEANVSDNSVYRKSVTFRFPNKEFTEENLDRQNFQRIRDIFEIRIVLNRSLLL